MLSELLDTHLDCVEHAARDNEFLDVTEVHRLHGLVRGALRRWPDLSPTQRETLSEAVHYLVRTDDEEDDLQSPIGLEDDTRVVETALRQITRPTAVETHSERRPR